MQPRVSQRNRVHYCSASAETLTVEWKSRATFALRRCATWAQHAARAPISGRIAHCSEIGDRVRQRRAERRLDVARFFCINAPQHFGRVELAGLGRRTRALIGMPLLMKARTCLRRMKRAIRIDRRSNRDSSFGQKVLRSGTGVWGGCEVCAGELHRAVGNDYVFQPLPN